MNEKLKGALKHWRFKPFMKDGKDVAVQTVIQLKGDKTEKHEDFLPMAQKLDF